MTLDYPNFTPTTDGLPPVDAKIEWISPSGQIVRGVFYGGAVWLPEGSDVYVYYQPVFWRVCP